jgi:hypothetical protein
MAARRVWPRWSGCAGSYPEAAELAEIFYPEAADEVRRLGRRTVPFDVLGINPPRDLAFKVLAA